jgi:MSHA biogenesis protein MshK
MNKHSHHGIILVLGVLSLVSLEATMALEDPTRPTNPAVIIPTHTSGSGNSSWVLNSTLVSPNRRVAVINGIQVSEGESVGGALVVQIHRSYALLQTSGRNIKLHLLPDTVKK